MDFIVNSITDAYSLWEYYLSLGDKRVENWLLMSSYWPTLALTATYLLTVYYGQKFMRSRPAFEFPRIMFLYNAFLVALNSHIFYEIVSASIKLKYSYTCQSVHYGDDPDELRIAKALWWYYFSKLIEFIDTIFFVLRKKSSQITFLHVYHHATMFPIWWTGVKWAAGGQSFFGAMINSFIHILMYTYYGVSALGPAYQKYLWWKRYMTRLQLIQFIMAIVYTARSLYYTCDYPLWMQWSLAVYSMSIMALFLNFYFHSYIKKSTKTQKLEPTNNGLYDKLSRHQISAGKTSNGHVNNGGYAAKNGGHMTNGGGGGGHMTNGKGAGQRSWTDGSGDHVGKKMQ